MIKKISVFLIALTLLIFFAYKYFSSSDKTAFENSYFYRVWFHLSTAGGSFTASNTYVTIRNFKLLYNHGTSTNNRWVVGKYRPKEKAGDEAIQGK